MAVDTIFVCVSAAVWGPKLSWWTMMLSLLTKNECLFLHAASRPSTWAWYTFVVRVWLREGSSQ